MRPNAKDKISEHIRESKRLASVAHVKLMTDQNQDEIHTLLLQARNLLNAASIILTKERGVK